MKMSILKSVAGLAGVAVLFTILLLRPGLAQTPTPAGTSTPVASDVNPPLRTVSVVGNGQVDVAPDQAIARLGVQTEGASATEALARNTQQMQALLDSLTTAGVARADIQTQSIQLYPRYTEPRPDVVTATQQIAGYNAANVVEVRVRDLGSLGTLLDAAVSAGGNTIENVRFVVSDAATRMDEARIAAVNDALHKAQQLALLTGAQLGEVITINEITPSVQPLVVSAAVRDAGGAVPVEAGTQTLSTQVQVTWRLLGSGPSIAAPTIAATPLATLTLTATLGTALPAVTATPSPALTPSTTPSETATEVPATVTPMETVTGTVTSEPTPMETVTGTVTSEPTPPDEGSPTPIP